MTNPASRQILRAIFDADTGHRLPASKPSGSINLSLPSLDERVEIYLHAVHGVNYSATAADRAAARRKFIDAVADDIAREVLENTAKPAKHPALSAMPAGMNWARQRQKALSTSMKHLSCRFWRSAATPMCEEPMVLIGSDFLPSWAMGRCSSAGSSSATTTSSIVPSWGRTIPSRRRAKSAPNYRIRTPLARYLGNEHGHE